MKSEFTIGKILRPRGVKGVAKIEPYTEDATRFSHLLAVKIGGKEYAVESVSVEGGFVYAKFSGVDTPEDVEALRGKSVSVRRADLPAPPKDRYYIVDLLGADVIVGGDVLGELVDVLQYGSADVYVVRLADGTVSFPALKEVVRSIDVEKGQILLDDRMFERTAVYNK